MAIAQLEQPTQRKKPVPSTAFIMDFVRMCFTEDLCEVDFTQSLKSMGYLQALEEKRKDEFTAAMKRLIVDSDLLQRDRHSFQIRYPEIFEWISSMEVKAKKVEALYTQVYVGLRRWTLINEMRLAPFNKQNCISMLNILYPPTYGSLPTSQLTENTLNAQRNAYFRYIQTVEKNGRDVLTNLEQASKRSGEPNGWPVVRDIVDVYLLKARSLIDDYRSAKNSQEFQVINREKRSVSDASLTSSNSDLSISEQNSTFSTKQSTTKRPTTSSCNSSPISEAASSNFSHTRFERFTRRLKSRNTDNRSESPTQLSKQSSFNEKQMSLRKMKSTTALHGEGSKNGKHSRENSSDRAGLPQFIIDDAQRERLIREAQKDKANHPMKHSPSPQQDIYQPKSRHLNHKIPEEASLTSCRITSLDQHPYHDPYSLPNLRLPSLKV